MRIGWGFDAHRIGPDGPMMIGGVVVAEDRGLVGTSDADVLLHAVADAILGAAALGDLGTHFPSSDEKWANADSGELLAHVVELARGSGLLVDSVDATVIAEKVRIGPHRESIRTRLAELLDVLVDRVSVKATSTDGMGYIGNDEGIAAVAVVVLN